MKQYEHIKLNRGDRERLKNLLGAKKDAITLACKFLRNSLAAREIRRIAVNILHCHLYVSKKRLFN